MKKNTNSQKQNEFKLKFNNFAVHFFMAKSNKVYLVKI